MSVEQAFYYVVSQIDANRETLKFLVEGVGRSTLRDMLYDDVRDVLLLEASMRARRSSWNGCLAALRQTGAKWPSG